MKLFLLSSFLFFFLQSFPKNTMQSLQQLVLKNQLKTWKNNSDILSLVQPFLRENPIIIEAGAYNGEDTILMSQFWPQGIIHSFEPVPQLFEKLTQKTKLIGTIYAHNFALGEKNEKIQMHVSEFQNKPNQPGASSSILPPKEHLAYFPDITFNKLINVQMITVDSWAQLNNIAKVDFFWFDLQGYELNALKGAEKILKTVKVILAEVSFRELYSGQPLFDKVEEWLNERNFKLYAINLYEWIGYGDALFIRTEN